MAECHGRRRIQGANSPLHFRNIWFIVPRQAIQHVIRYSTGWNRTMGHDLISPVSMSRKARRCWGTCQQEVGDRRQQDQVLQDGETVIPDPWRYRPDKADAGIDQVVPTVHLRKEQPSNSRPTTATNRSLRLGKPATASQSGRSVSLGQTEGRGSGSALSTGFATGRPLSSPAW